MKLKRVKYDRKNEVLQQLVDMLFKASRENKVNFWKRVAQDLLRPVKHQSKVNVSKIEKYGDDRIVVVAGKVLGYGELTKKVQVVAQSFSVSAEESIKKAGGSVTLLKDFVKKNPKATNVKLLE